MARNGKKTIQGSMKDLFTGLAMVGVVLAMVLFVVFMLEEQAVSQFIATNNIDRGETVVADEEHSVGDNADGGLPSPIVLTYTPLTDDTVTVTVNGTTELTELVNYTILSRVTGTLNFTSIGNFTAGNETLTIDYTYYDTDDTEDECNDLDGTPCSSIREGFDTAEELITMGLGLLGLIAIILVFIGYVLPVIQRIM